MVRRQSQEALVAPCKDLIYSPACVLPTDVVSYPSQLISGFIELIEESFQEVNQDTAPKVGRSVLFTISLGKQVAIADNEIYLMG